MSGLTPILDTLLHQVLGKRVDIQPEKSTNQPVSEVTASDPARAVKSDSRLDPRLLEPGVKFTEKVASGSASTSQTQTPASPTSPSSANPAADLRMSATARLLSNLLTEKPLLESAIRPDRTMLPSGQAEVFTPTRVAQQIQQSIRESGLFYESHLDKWFNGKLSVEHLSREPQMQLFKLVRQSAGESVGTASGGNATNPSTTPEQQPQAPRLGAILSMLVNPRKYMPVTPTPTMDAEPVMDNGDQTSSRHVKDMGSELQTIVRHQLELLGTPVLRWEGEITTGMFLQMNIHPPEDEYLQRDDQQGEDNQQEPQPWQSDLNLTLPNLGAVYIKLSLRAHHLSLDIVPASAEARALIEANLDDFTQRMKDRGFEQPAIAVKARNDDG